ncbi:MAG: BON domain-containing protein [Betaproteobacteria bacterium]|jgi:osmotically-inducible protein OsmY
MKTLSLFVILFLCSLSSCSLVGPAQDDHGKRTYGTKWDDKNATKLILKRLKSELPEVKKMNVNATVFNGVALLTGQTNEESVKARAGELAEEIRHVSKVYNEIEIAGPTAFLARRNDDILKTKIKSRQWASEAVAAGRIKVVVENGVVYLMGLVTREEAASAVEEAKAAYGIQKIVQAFEFIN